MRSLLRQIVFVSEVAFLIVLTLVVPQLQQRAKLENDTGLPMIEVALNGVTLEEIKDGEKTTKYPGNQVSIFNGNTVTDYQNVELKGRGNSTWVSDKRPFQLKFDQRTDLFGLGKARKWVLLANYYDTSSLRNDTALYLGEMLGLNYTKSGRFVELKIDGDYQGLYYLTHKIEIGKTAVDLRNSAGLLVELDNFRFDDRVCYQTAQGSCLKERDMVEEELSDVAMADFLADYNQLEIAAAARDFATVESLIDVRSFAQYFLLSEFTVNPDAYSSSCFMYKDGLDDKIHAGPGWDFDFALGNRKWQWTDLDSFHAPDQDMIREIDALGGQFIVDSNVIEKEPDLAISKLYYNLMKMSEFQNVVREVYTERLAGRETELMQHIERKASEIYLAAVKNNDLWQDDDFGEETKYLLNWVATRSKHFDKVYGVEEKKYVITL